MKFGVYWEPQSLQLTLRNPELTTHEKELRETVEHLQTLLPQLGLCFESNLSLELPSP